MCSQTVAYDEVGLTFDEPPESFDAGTGTEEDVEEVEFRDTHVNQCQDQFA